MWLSSELKFNFLKKKMFFILSVPLFCNSHFYDAVCVNGPSGSHLPLFSENLHLKCCHLNWNMCNLELCVRLNIFPQRFHIKFKFVEFWTWPQKRTKCEVMISSSVWSMFSRLQTEQSVALSVCTLCIYCNHRMLRIKKNAPVHIVMLCSPTFFWKFACDIVPVLCIYTHVFILTVFM